MFLPVVEFLSSGAIIIGFYHWGWLMCCVLLLPPLRGSNGDGMCTPWVSPFRGFHLFRGFHPRLWSFAPTVLFLAVLCRQDTGRRDVACNVFLPIMVFLPLDNAIVGMEYGDVARYVSTCLDALLSFFHGAQQRFSVTGDFRR